MSAETSYSSGQADSAVVVFFFGGVRRLCKLVKLVSCDATVVLCAYSKQRIQLSLCDCGFTCVHQLH